MQVDYRSLLLTFPEAMAFPLTIALIAFCALALPLALQPKRWVTQHYGAQALSNEEVCRAVIDSSFETLLSTIAAAVMTMVAIVMSGAGFKTSLIPLAAGAYFGARVLRTRKRLRADVASRLGSEPKRAHSGHAAFALGWIISPFLSLFFLRLCFGGELEGFEIDLAVGGFLTAIFDAVIFGMAGSPLNATDPTFITAFWGSFIAFQAIAMDLGFLFTLPDLTPTRGWAIALGSITFNVWLAFFCGKKICRWAE